MIGGVDVAVGVVGVGVDGGVTTGDDVGYDVVYDGVGVCIGYVVCAWWWCWY